MAWARQADEAHGPPLAGEPRGRATTGITAGLAGVATSLVWGLAFLVPMLLPGWNPVVVTLGRYLAYGLVSVLLFVLGGSALRRLAREQWRLALGFAVAGNVGYYLLLVIGIWTAGAPLTDMVIGAIPVAVAVAGNLLSPAYRWRSLVLPLALVAIGLTLVSVLEIFGTHAYLARSPGETAAGVAAACGADI
jgi:drug/metabolite transporter (DMT)-like permease